MAYQVTFGNGREFTVFETPAPLTVERATDEAIKQYGTQAYRWSEELGRAVWVDIEVPPVVAIQRMKEVYMGGGYCLVPA